MGIPSGYFLAKHDFWGKGALDTLLDIPLVMPPLVAGVGLLFLLGQGMLGGPLGRMGIHLVLSPWGAVVAQAFVATPIVIRSSKAAFESVDPGYQAAAMTLGLSPFKVFVKINLPLAGRSVASGIILGWTRALGEFGATLMVAGATRFHTETLPIAVYLNVSSGELGIAVTCALVLVSAAFLLLLVLRFVRRMGPAGI
jgi:molybdate transport system permease protein